MPHDMPLIATMVAALGLAFALGAAAHWLRVSPLVGYLLAGVAVGPFTPGFVGDQSLAVQLAEIGVILLMFGVGLHFSLKDLLAVKAIAIPGAVAQIVLATLLGAGLAALLGWPPGGGLIFGLALSVASTVVLLRALQERRLVETERGRIAVGWLIVEDLAMVLALVLIPTLAPLLKPEAGGASPDLEVLLTAIAATIAKVAAFVALMLLVGRRAIPWLLHWVAHSGSRELFRLAVLALALVVAYLASELFGVSFALGAFFAGMVLSESPLSQRAAEETLPLRDAFAVLFFVSVGMLFDPSVLVRDFWAALAVFLIITIGKSAAAYLIVRAFRHPPSTAFTISASLAQIGEFSFILATLGVSYGLLPERGRDLILAGAILSILANPLFFLVLDRITAWLDRNQPKAAQAPEAAAPEATRLREHAVVVGSGRVGGLIVAALRERGRPFLVIEERQALADRLRADGAEVIVGNAAHPAMLQAAELKEAKLLFVAIPEAFEAGQIVVQSRQANPALRIIARAHGDEEVEHLGRLGADAVVMGERQIAREMLQQAFGDGSDLEPPGGA